MGTTARSRLALVAAGGVAAALAATTAFASGQAIQPPPNVKSAGKIVYCTDATYPPEESFQGSKIVGSDIDIATGVAKLMGLKAEFKNTGFDGIIAALLSKNCDAIISGMNDTPERRKQVDFVDYLKVGQSIMVKKGNPDKISSLESLSGKHGLGRVGDDEPRLPGGDVEEARRQGQEGDQHQDLPEGHRRFRRAEGRSCGRVLRRRAAGRVLRRRRTRRSWSPAPGQPVPDRDRDPQEGSAAGRHPEGDRPALRQRLDEEDRRQVGHGERSSCSRNNDDGGAPDACRGRLARRLGTAVPPRPRLPSGAPDHRLHRRDGAGPRRRCSASSPR